MKLNVIKVLKKLFFSIVLLEIFLCGSGQILKVTDSLTLKMINYSIMLIIGGYYVLKYKFVNADVFKIFFFYTILLLIGIIFSVINNGTNNLFNDLSPLFYMYTIFYFYFTINDVEYKDLVKEIVKFCSISLAIIYLIYLLLVYFGILDFPVLYVFLSPRTELIFRGETGELFYSGFLYLIIGLCFYIFDNKPFSLQAILLLLAIYFTKTRGFYVITILTYVLFYVNKFKESHYKIKKKSFRYLLFSYCYQFIFYFLIVI